MAADWDMAREDILAIWCEKAGSLGYLHEKAASAKGALDRALTLPVIFIGVATSSIGAIAASGGDTSTLIQYTVAGFNLASALLLSTSKYLAPGDAAITHKDSAKAFSVFSRRLRFQLALPPDDREASAPLLEESRVTFNRLVEAMPPLPESVINAFSEKSGVHLPDVVAGPSPVGIYGRVLPEPEEADVEEGSIDPAEPNQL
ncbi:MAG: hypothetical protein CMA10_04565 [Euryarchaeota archaeon]|nr:hypothetical protein [Euryarchaeota archaeon]|tara:strand:- start:444 stop:1052 length:609 start_codon:yes stop_codon:yes gene_type:complete